MRRMVWIVFVPVVLGMGFLIVLMMANFSKMLSFGHANSLEIEYMISRAVVWGAFGLAIAAWLISRLFKARKKGSDSGGITSEIASIFMAIFFGGMFALAHSHNEWWAFILPVLAYTPWLLLVEAKKPQKKPHRKAWRMLAWTIVPVATFLLINYAAFS